MIPLAAWQWRVLNLWGTTFFEWANQLAEKPVPIPGAVAYTSFVPICFVALLIAEVIVAVQNRRSRDLVAPGAHPPSAPYLVTAIAFSFLYVISTAWLALQENELRTAIGQTVTHEGRYFAELLHKSWPENPLTGDHGVGVSRLLPRCRRHREDHLAVDVRQCQLTSSEGRTSTS